LEHEEIVAPAVCIVEGPVDALAAATEGLVGLALLNNTPSEEVLTFASTLTRRKTCLFVSDNDSPLAMTRIMAYFMSHGAASGKLLLPAPHKDLAEMPRKLRGRFLHG